MTSKSEVENKLSRFYRQAALFQALGQQMEKYLGCIEDMQLSMTELHSTITNYFGTLSPPQSTFTMLLEDQNELWTLLEQDIVKLGEDFQEFAKYFHGMLKKKESFKERSANLSKLRQEIGATNVVRHKEADLRKDTQSFLESLKDFDDKQRNFLLSHYKRFIDAHSEYTKDVQEIINQMPDALRSLQK